jgi:protein-S-isoprenylcysteine O-methyltransferase Ste14
MLSDWFSAALQTSRKCERYAAPLSQRVVPLGFLPPPADSLVGWVVVGSGMALRAWSELQFARHKTSHDHRATASALITTGPFQFSRNPVYIGLLILLVGLAMMLNTLWVLFFTPLALLVMQFHVVPREEACLEQIFPYAYPSVVSRYGVGYDPPISLHNRLQWTVRCAAPPLNRSVMRQGDLHEPSS